MDKNNKKKIICFILIFSIAMYIKSVWHPYGHIKLAGNMHSKGEYKYDSSTLLSDGTILIVGGGCGDAKAEIYDPKMDTFSVIAAPHSEHYWHKTILLKNGNVLIVSSQGIEVFDKTEKTFKVIKNSELLNRYKQKEKHIKYPPVKDNFFILENGDILLYKSNEKNNTTPLFSDLQIYDKETIKLKNKLVIKHLIKTPHLLPDGKILFDIKDSDHRGLYNQKDNTFTVTDNYKKTEEQIKNEQVYKNAINAYKKISSKFKKYTHEPIVLKSGNILFLSQDRNYIYRYKNNKLYRISDFARWRRGFSTSILPNGDVLITGGSCGNKESHLPFTQAEIYTEK